jgi:hypothetical protein
MIVKAGGSNGPPASEPELAAVSHETTFASPAHAGWQIRNGASMKRLLIVTAVIEVGAGVALLCCPSATVNLLLGSGLDTSPAVTLGRVGGAALLALGVACWFAQYDAQNCAARGLVTAIVLYNLGTVIILGTAGVGSQPAGVALWPAVVLHAAMAVWCITSLLIEGDRSR